MHFFKTVIISKQMQYMFTFVPNCFSFFLFAHKNLSKINSKVDPP